MKPLCFKLALLLVVLSVFSGCKSRQILVREDGHWKKADIAGILDQNHLRKNENIRVIPLDAVPAMSLFLVIVRDSEKPHFHESHDLSVVIQKGRGIMHLNQKSYAVREGDILFIPRGMVHYFINTGKNPAAAYCVFSPAYDGKDIIPVPSEPHS